MIKILFVHAVNRYAEIENRYPPLWPAYLVSYLEHKKNASDFVFGYTSDNFEKELDEFAPDIVAMSCVTQNYHIAKQYAFIAKKRGCPVIIGGIHITSLPGTLSEDMDIGVIGEGEKTFLEIMEHYSKYGSFDKERLSDIDGIVFRRDDRLVITRDRDPFATLDNIPSPKFEMMGFRNRGYIYTARGCAYRCLFCVCSRYWGKIRYSSPAKVIDEIETLVKLGIRIIRFGDENFTGNPPRLREIAQLITARGLNKKVKFSCWCRSNTITPEVVKMLKSVNIVSVKLGLESGCQRILDYLKGNVTIEDNERAVFLLKSAGFQVNADFIIGSPEETEEEMMMTYDFIRRQKLDFIDVNLFTAYPGTPVWEAALRDRIVSEDMDWRRINIDPNRTKGDSLILSKTMTPKRIRTVYRRFQRLVFFKMVNAVIHTPWKRELPRVIYRQIKETIFNR